MSYQIKKGLNNINKGSQSMTIGSNAEKIATKPTAKLSEKATTAAVAETNDALTSLNSINSKIVSVTGEDTATPTATSESSDTNQQKENSDNTQTGAAANITETNTENTNNTTVPTTENNVENTNEAVNDAPQTTQQTQEIAKTPSNLTTKDIEQTTGNSNTRAASSKKTKRCNRRYKQSFRNNISNKHKKFFIRKRR